MRSVSALPPRRSGPDFKYKLTEVIPALRAFARSLCRDRTLADDLVQETLLKAWAARSDFKDDCSLKSWVFTILHNAFHSEWRATRRMTPLDNDSFLTEDRTTMNAEAGLELLEVSRAISRLPVEQQEALILIAACGFTYGEAAKITRGPVGTMKSRVCRARQALTSKGSGS